MSISSFIGEWWRRRPIWDTNLLFDTWVTGVHGQVGEDTEM